MDFITKLPLSGGHDTILTITDTDCSKASIFIPCHETIDSEGVAQLYLTHVVPHFSIPHKIISDRDVRFTSKFLLDVTILTQIFILPPPPCPRDLRHLSQPICTLDMYSLELPSKSPLHPSISRLC